MNKRRIITGCLMCLATAAAVRGEDSLPKLRTRGAEVYYADLDLRIAFAKTSQTDLPEARRKPPEATVAAFDWSTFLQRKIKIPQADSANCWAFAALTAFEYNWVIRNGDRMPRLAVQPILDRTGKNGTGYTGWALQDLVERGTCLTSAYPSIGKPDKLRAKVPMPYRAIAWGQVTGNGGDPTVEQLKKALRDHGPLVAHMNLTAAFRAYKGGIHRDNAPPPKTPSGHFVVIVGWDESKGKAGCWKIENCWGEKWGESGFMWVEHGSNQIGHEAYWVRAQAIQYPLPSKIHKRVTAATTPFPKWPDVRRVTVKPPELPVLTPVQALRRQGERVVMRFRVRGGGIHSSDGHVELFSTTSWRNEKNLIVRILKSELGKFPAKSDRELLKSYSGKEIRVRGSVQANWITDGTKLMNRPIIEVGDPEQIEILK